MKTHEFTIVASGLDPNARDFEDRFYEAGCDDATLSYQKGVIVVDFSREAKDFAEALTSALTDVQKTGAKIERVEPDYLVSLSDIAARSGLSRAAISLYCKGVRGRGFPSPVVRVTSESPLWDWVDVSHWLQKHKRLKLDDVARARVVKKANMLIGAGQIKQRQMAKHLRASADLAA